MCCVWKKKATYGDYVFYHFSGFPVHIFPLQKAEISAFSDCASQNLLGHVTHLGPAISVAGYHGSPKGRPG